MDLFYKSIGDYKAKYNGKSRDVDLKKYAVAEVNNYVNQKAKEKESESKEKLMKICYEMRNDSMVEDSEKSWRKIGLKLNLNHITVKKYAEEYEEKLKSDIQLNQLEEKMQDQEFVDPDEEVEDENDSED